MAVRKELKAEADAMGIKLSYMPFMLKAASLALYRYPDLNRCDEKGSREEAATADGASLLRPASPPRCSLPALPLVALTPWAPTSSAMSTQSART